MRNVFARIALAILVSLVSVSIVLVASSPILATRRLEPPTDTNVLAAPAAPRAYLPMVPQTQTGGGIVGGTPTVNPAAVPTPRTTPTGPSADITLLAAGDMRNCNTGIKQVAALVQTMPGVPVVMLGDATVTGDPSEYPCYDAAWGQFKDRTIPVIGNHEYLTAGAPGYFGYFGAAAHGPQAYYSFDLGTWHLIALNSNCSQVGGCQSGSTQEQWLKADLAKHPNQCTLAMWHHPLFNSGNQGNTLAVKPLVRDLVDAGVRLMVVAHEHNYERFARQSPDGVADPNGIREFIVGTGGAGGGSWVATAPNSEVHAVSVLGVIKLTLHATSYDWQFVPIPGTAFTDSGSDSCK